uniref:Serine/threonine-protein kinase 10 (Trinotate prediction) n=1 Tax=Henneguya salminicola TaxID=69463 RepID=A0A6G3MK60_HENSL
MFNKFKKSNQIKVFKKKDPCLDFTLGSQIGSGSFGNVYLANDLNGNIVVIKVCEATCDEEKKYFEREAEILKMCEHPNILTAIDFYYWDKKSWVNYNFIYFR